MSAAALLIRHALFPAWIAKNRSRRLAYLAAFERSQYLPPDELRSLQWALLQVLLAHAYEQCPFYRRKYQAAGLHPSDVKSLEDLRLLPTVTKQEIQESLDDFIALSHRARPLRKDMTGGSTGTPMVFYYDDDRLDSRVAATLRHNRWTGWNIGDKMALLWGSPRDVAAAPSMKARVRDWILDRRVILDASALDPERMLRFCAVLERERPAYMLAYANTLAFFAQFVRDNGLHPIRPKAIICSGEFLAAESRALIESTFGCHVFNRYGSREFAVIASECQTHQGLHVNAENLVVESVGGPTGPRELVVTDLRNLAMPMIRYRTMDAGALDARTCKCGRTLPLLQLQGGRTTDFLVGTQGQRVSGIVLATYGITELPGVRQVQFVQRRRDRVTARVVRGPSWSEATHAALVTRIQTWLGETMAVDVELTDAIPVDPSGKYRFSIAALDD